MNNTAISAIPACCRKCGELFDLSYDIKEMGEERMVFELMTSTRNPRTSLCWDCRQKI